MNNMIVEGENPLLEKQNFIQTRTPNKVELAALIKKAKGVDRTMADYAKSCGVSPSMFSRIANCNISQPLSWEILVKIFENACEDSCVTWVELLEADGYVLKGKQNHENKRVYDLKNNLKDIIVNELLERGVAIQYLKRIPVSEKILAGESGCGRGNLFLKLQDYDPSYWKFKTMVSSARHRPGWDTTEDDAEYEADCLFHDEAETLLADLWQPERLKKLRIAYVFSDYELFERFYDRLKVGKVNGTFSVIYIDVESNAVCEERFIERIDGIKPESLFDLPIL